MAMRISMIGLGNMGRPLAENILKAEKSLAIYSSKKATAARFEKLGARIALEPGELADCDVFCTCLPRPEDVVARMTGPDGFYASMKPGSLHLEFSTIDPETAEMLEKAAGANGIEYVQAPVGKTPRHAEQGESPFFVGGKPHAVDKIFPLLEKIGKPEKTGSVRAACFIKILSNQMGMANLAVLAEGLKLAELAGLDRGVILKALAATGAASFQMQTRGPWIVESDYNARFAVDLAVKDLSIGETMAKGLGFNPPMLSQALTYMRQAAGAGFGEEDMCAIYKIVQDNPQ